MSTRKFESTRTELCTLAYPMHLLPKDNQAKSTMHNNSLSKLCQQMCRLAVVCLGEQDCKKEQGRVDTLRFLCIVDVARRLLEQVKTKIVAAKPDAVNISATNVALGKFSQACESIPCDEATLSDCIQWCLGCLQPGLPDPEAKKAAILDKVKEWHALKLVLTEKRGDFIKNSVAKELDALKEAIGQVPPIGYRRIRRRLSSNTWLS